MGTNYGKEVPSDEALAFADERWIHPLNFLHRGSLSSVTRNIGSFMDETVVNFLPFGGAEAEG